MDYLWQQRHRASDLVGTVLNIHSGDWVRRDAGVGAGVDSYYEYLLKAYVLLGDTNYLERFNTHYAGIMKYISQGPLLVDVHMHRPQQNAKTFMDALLAFWPGLQVLKGDLKPAVETHELLYQVMRRHNGLMPEAWSLTDFQVHWGQHFIRPEFVESTYFLYKATGDPHYLEVGREVLRAVQKFTRTPCGFAAVKDVRTGTQEDRMDSFVLAETFKYLYLLFSTKSDLILDLDEFVFTTEAHLLPLRLALQSNRTATPNTVVIRRRKLPKSSPYKHFLQHDATDEQDRTCPNTRGDYSHIRAALRDFVNSPLRPLTPTHGSCTATKVPRRQLKLAAEDFSASNPAHLEAIKRMGISAVVLPDGRVQLVHSAAAAASPDDAEDGAVFMHDMINLSRQQLMRAEEQLRTVAFTSPKTGVRVQLAAGPAQFGPDLNTQGTSVSAAARKVQPYDACEWPLSDESVRTLKNKIGIVQRGDCMFIQKVACRVNVLTVLTSTPFQARHVQRAGGVGMIVIDNMPTTTAAHAPMFAMSGDGSTDVTIPVVFLYGQEGQVLLDVLTEFRDVIVHLEPSHLASDKPHPDTAGTETDMDTSKTISEEHDDTPVGVGHVSEVPIDDHLASNALDGIEEVFNAVAADISKRYMHQIGITVEDNSSRSRKVSKQIVQKMFNQVITKSLETFRDVIDDKKYKILEPVLKSVITSFKNVNEAQNMLHVWLDELRQEKYLATGVSINPLRNTQAFIKFIVHGFTERR